MQLPQQLESHSGHVLLLVLFSGYVLLWSADEWGYVTSNTLYNGYSAPMTCEHANKSYPPTIHTEQVNCIGLFENDEKSILVATEYQTSYSRPGIQDKRYLVMTQNCSRFIQTRGYVTEALSDEEADFPIAYTIMAYKNLEQTERFLRAIYRPHNYHCIHVDSKSSTVFKSALNAITQCLPNVTLASRAVSVVWGQWSVVEAEFACMDDLLLYPRWAYHMNLAAEEFPLKTNLEIVRILKAFNGSNLMEASKNLMERYEYRYRKRYVNLRAVGPKEPPPLNVTMHKGSFLVIATRGFVEYVRHNRTARIFGEWVKDTLIPDELFFSTLNHNPRLGAPGAYKGIASTSKYYPFLNRFIAWKTDTYEQCHGKYIRQVCVFSIRDLHTLYNRPELFVNKFHLSFHPFAYTCMEQLLYDRIRDEIRGHRNFNASYYSQFEFTWNHN